MGIPPVRRPRFPNHFLDWLVYHVFPLGIFSVALIFTWNKWARLGGFSSQTVAPKVTHSCKVSIYNWTSVLQITFCIFLWLNIIIGEKCRILATFLYFAKILIISAMLTLASLCAADFRKVSITDRTYCEQMFMSFFSPKSLLTKNAAFWSHFYIPQNTIYMMMSSKWKYIPRYWPFVRGFHRWPLNSPHKGQWRGALRLVIWDAIAPIMTSL